MTIRYQRSPGDIALAEMKEFAAFPSRTQRYIRRSLDVGLARDDAVARWSRDGMEAAGIRVQERVYERLDEMRLAMPDDGGLDAIGLFMGGLISISAFDLGQDRLPHFASYRFLYERLLGAAARPWLPGAFCAAAALPHLHPDKRKVLLQSLGEGAAMAAGWSSREPAFFPAWVEKIDSGIDDGEEGSGAAD